MKFSKEEMRARFHEAMDEADKLMAKVQPKRDEYNRLRGEIDRLREKQEGLASEFRPVIAEAAKLHEEAAMLNRALGGKTGPRK